MIRNLTIVMQSGLKAAPRPLTRRDDDLGASAAALIAEQRALIEEGNEIYNEIFLRAQEWASRWDSAYQAMEDHPYSGAIADAAPSMKGTGAAAVYNLASV